MLQTAFLDGLSYILAQCLVLTAKNILRKTKMANLSHRFSLQFFKDHYFKMVSFH